MDGKVLYGKKSLLINTVDLAAQCPLTGSGVVGTLTLNRGVTSIVKTGASTGKYTLTLDDSYNACLVFLGAVITTVAGGHQNVVQQDETDTVTAKTIKFSVFQDGALADIAGTLTIYMLMQNTGTQA